MFTRLYIHIPFCRQKCPYCSFFSNEDSGEGLERYTKLLLQEMNLAATKITSKRPLDSIYFGGGTPSLLAPEFVNRLIAQAKYFFGLITGAEVTLEANPGTVDFQRLSAFRQAGVTRLSLGIQTFDDQLLRVLGRIHTSHQAKEAFIAARQAAFDNIGIDLINALPGQTLDMWQADLKQVRMLAPEHLSVYGLTIEKGTPFANQFDKNVLLLPNEDLAADMFEQADDFLESCGYEHYEISNYARTGFRARHNSGYWERDGYLGLGTGAHSFLKNSEYGTRFCNTTDQNIYCAALQNGTLPHKEIIPLSRVDAVAEYLFLRLRMNEGVSFNAFGQEFKTKLKDLFDQQLCMLLKHGLLTEDSSGIRITRRGMLLSNFVFQQFLP